MALIRLSVLIVTT